MTKRLDDQVTEALAERVMQLIEARGPGHCLQVAHVPMGVADAACKRVDRLLEGDDRARLVTADPKRDWHATPAKVVELRNQVLDTGGRFALFVPAGQLMAAEDSFGRSTFEVVLVDDLYRGVVERLERDLQSIAPDIAERAELILSAARGGEKAEAARDEAAYLSRLVASPSEEELGTGLSELGLLPDRGLASEGDSDLPARLTRNRQQMEALSEPLAPVDRMNRVAIPGDIDDAKEISTVLLDAVQDGVVDSREIAARVEHSGSSVDLSSLLAPSDMRPVLNELNFISLVGDFVDGSDPPTIKKSKATVKSRFRCRPAASTVLGLKDMRLELVQVGEGGDLTPVGVDLVKKRSSLPKGTDASWSMRVDTEAVDAGLYRLRITAFDEDNLEIAKDVSDTFRVHEEIEDEAAEESLVTSVWAAQVDARCRDSDLIDPGAPMVAAGQAARSSDPTLPLSIRFSEVQGRSRLELSRALVGAERMVIQDPESLARYTLSLSRLEIVDIDPLTTLERIPRDFLVARTALFEGIRAQQLVVDGELEGSIYALANLVPLAQEVRHYLSTWAAALETSRDSEVMRDLLRIDQVAVEDDEFSNVSLIGPTHPLRTAWLLNYQEILNDWVKSDEVSEREGRELSALLPALAPANVPHVMLGKHEELRYLEPLDLFWGIWAPPSEPDAGGLAAGVRARLGLPRSTAGAISVDAVVQRIERYLAAHPYVDLLELNFVQAGYGDIVLQTLLALQAESQTADLRYRISLFTADLSHTDHGRALDEFMADPDALKGLKREAADAFLSSAEDPLSPKLVYSKHKVSELLDEPDRFPAHLTFFLDWFELDAVPVARVSDRRSFFANGLIVDPVVVYRAGDVEMNPQWDEHVATLRAEDDAFEAGFAACERATSALLGPAASGTVPAVRLELDRVRRSILDAVHAKSDWVVVIDRVFTDEYLDSPPAAGETARYLIDSTDQGSLETGRRIMVSTRTRSELISLFRPVLTRYELEIQDDRVEVLLDALQALSAGLPLKLLNNRTQALEALSLSLATSYLAKQGVLRRALAIPLDMHADLFREGVLDSGVDSMDLRRTDLAVVRIDPARRLLDFHLVEVKARAQLPATTPEDLVAQIEAQLENSEQVLRRRLLSNDLRKRRGSVAGALMVRRLTRLLSRYIERAVRYRFMEPTLAAEARAFITTLDGSFSYSFSRHALIFDLQGESQSPEQLGELSVKRIGLPEIIDLLNETQVPVGTDLPEREIEDVRTAFGAKSQHLVEEIPAASEEGEAQQEPEPPRAEDPAPGQVPKVAEEPAPQADEGPDPADVLQLGATPYSRQFGVIGRLGGRDVALDVDGTNVISVFGVQGSGKSYTVGNLIEAALIRDPVLNRLPQPLAAVVFHYSSDETYLPEFAEMAEANDNENEVMTLMAEYGASPHALPDVQVLVPADLVEERQRDFPGLSVHPIELSPDELNVNDWKLLMGVEGGEQLYVKALTNIFRKLRRDLSVKSLRKAIKESDLSQQQKSLADQRLHFAETYLGNGDGISSLMAPGRLLIVDVRDQLMGKEEVLSLFMVMLQLFSSAKGRDDKASFNKMIVFDEAHKYMENSRLTSAIVEAVREMRHKGTSVVLASQNPPSVPKEVIELSTAIVAHKFTAPAWLDHIKKVNDAFGRDLTPQRLATLGSGEAFVWSSGGAEELRRPQRLKVRPRLTRHGGATRRATSE